MLGSWTSWAVLLGSVVALTTAACPGKQVLIVSFAPKTTVSFADTSRCSGDRCTCRSDTAADEPESGIPDGHKRFEFRLPQSTSALWVEVAGKGVFYKPPDQVPPTCFYLDLPAGEHPVTVHAENRDAQVGLQSGLTVREFGAKTTSWYRSLHFVCGGLSRCTRQDLQTWASFQRGLPRGVLDPCGSVMVRGVTFGGTRHERRDDEYSDVTVRMTIKVYEFEPYHPPNSPECKAPTKNR